MPAVRIVIIDQPLTAEGLRLMLQDHFSVLGVGSDGVQAVAMSAALQPDVLVMDPSIGEPDGLDVILRVKALTPKVKVLFMSGHSHRFALGRAMQIGAEGLVLKQQQPEELCQAIRTVARGGTYVAPQLRDEVPGARGLRAVKSPDRQSRLTARQREVLHLLAQGRTSKEIGSLLGISAKTVEFHRGSLMEGLGLHSVAELSRFAMQNGLVCSPN
jgi:DNA-binding NarL/FixJ family response regulator